MVVDALEGAAQLTAVANQIGTETQVFFHGHRRVGFLALGHLHEPALDGAVGTQAVDALAVEQHGALPWLEQARDGLQNRRFSGAVAVTTEQRSDASVLDTERDPSSRRRW
jgi:hypothetical protein